MAIINFAEIAKGHYEEIIGKMIEMTADNCGYQRDLYIYPDGSLYVFDNVGGNSWLNDDHEVVWKYNAMFSEYVDEDGKDLDREDIIRMCNENYDSFRTELDGAIEQLRYSYDYRVEQSSQENNG